MKMQRLKSLISLAMTRLSANQSSLPSDIVIRRATPDDAALLSLIGGATFLETFYDSIKACDILAHASGPHSEAYYRKALEAGAAIWLAMHHETDTPIGYQMLSKPDLPVDTSKDDIELKRIYIFSRHHGSGIAAEFERLAYEEACVRGCKRLLLGVYSQNHRGIAFYEKYGFEIISDRIFTVGDTDYKDWIMAKNLV